MMLDPSQKTESPFQLGVKLAISVPSFGRERWKISKVKKVYKTGNFLVEGTEGQWRPSSGRTAWKCGSRNWNHTIAYIFDDVSDRVLGSIKIERTKKRLSAISKKIDTIDPSSISDDVLSKIESLLEQEGKSDGKDTNPVG